MSVIVTAGKRCAVPKASRVTPRAFEVLVKKHRKQMNFIQWFHREMKEGGHLQEYIARERAQSERRLRAVAQRTDGFKQNAKSDLQVKAHIPAREFFRWKQQDPDFWRDDGNLRSFRRSNPDARVYV